MFNDVLGRVAEVFWHKVFSFTKEQVKWGPKIDVILKQKVKLSFHDRRWQLINLIYTQYIIGRIINRYPTLRWCNIFIYTLVWWWRHRPRTAAPYQQWMELMPIQHLWATMTTKWNGSVIRSIDNVISRAKDIWRSCVEQTSVIIS